MVLKICDTKRENGMNLNEECLLKYLQNHEELFNLTDVLNEFNVVLNNSENKNAAKAVVL